MSDLERIERQWIILRTLAARKYGATVRELADEHGVSQKTIRRDLTSLRNSGFPISPCEGDHGRNNWIASFDPHAPPLTFDVSEILGLYVSRALLEPLAGTVIWSSTQSAFRKIKATLGESVLAYLDQLTSLIHRTSFRDSDYRDKSQYIDDLMVAIEDQRIAFITYQSVRSTEPLTYDVYPYGLVYHRGSLYLVANSQQHGEVRNFKLDRISDVSLELLKFEKPADFDLRSYLRNSLGVFHTDGQPQRVVIRFAADVARYVEEHHWHDSQQLTREKEGTVLAEMHLANLEEVASWILSFGAKATVLEPLELRERIFSEVRAILDQADTVV